MARKRHGDVGGIMSLHHQIIFHCFHSSKRRKNQLYILLQLLQMEIRVAGSNLQSAHNSITILTLWMRVIDIVTRLIDDEMEARVADFGVATLMQWDESMSVIAGFYGYIALGYSFLYEEEVIAEPINMLGGRWFSYHDGGTKSP
ncbi:leucine-rich repeat receptor-like protein kinase TDR [Artemisia annua]|uniref:Leucine-rich repeat receptor-like protein kinase TDR n=1 Tax=Artemisia annua TaxID=35608 RepID=A0A2U1NQ32_ARTAN|nr:leucine-rich repeat receptor-like protein kinase TDR [Artemisia annua]